MRNPGLALAAGSGVPVCGEGKTRTCVGGFGAAIVAGTLGGSGVTVAGGKAVGVFLAVAV